MKQYGYVMLVTSELIATIVVFIFIGQWADGHFHTGQKALIVAAVLGSVLGFVRFIINLQRLNKDSGQNDERKDDH